MRRTCGFERGRFGSNASGIVRGEICSNVRDKIVASVRIENNTVLPNDISRLVWAMHEADHAVLHPDDASKMVRTPPPLVGCPFEPPKANRCRNTSVRLIVSQHD
jgi:hypothetical protein